MGKWEVFVGSCTVPFSPRLGAAFLTEKLQSKLLWFGQNLIFRASKGGI
jgi:hypothetical protein